MPSRRETLISAAAVALIVGAVGYAGVVALRIQNTPVGQGPPVVGSTPTSSRHAELLAEIFQVVLGVQSPPEADRAQEFRALLNSLDQGASLEGVYRGIVADKWYRALEKSEGPATPRALSLFGSLMQALVEVDGLQIARPEFDLTPGELPHRWTSSRTASPQVARTADDYSRLFVGQSVATLRRILGDQALDTLEASGSLRAETYANWVEAFCRIPNRPDFGLKRRNECGGGFHLDWAHAATSDAIAWETLNRLHRLMLAAEAPR